MADQDGQQRPLELDAGEERQQGAPTQARRSTERGRGTEPTGIRDPCGPPRRRRGARITVTSEVTAEIRLLTSASENVSSAKHLLVPARGEALEGKRQPPVLWNENSTTTPSGTNRKRSVAATTIPEARPRPPQSGPPLDPAHAPQSHDEHDHPWIAR